ncbi:transposase [Thermomonospora amylolytica]|uniref:transposase n=1 Tax=Thermomonospora amylolytica TaxID=1411117 RepID=UPI000E6BE8E2|nr:transposase [Thermomonospora amylolytica]
MSERAAPFYCPYCGEEDLRPLEGEGSWYCADCARSFRLRFLGVGAPSGGPTDDDRGAQP